MKQGRGVTALLGSTVCILQLEVRTVLVVSAYAESTYMYSIIRPMKNKPKESCHILVKILSEFLTETKICIDIRLRSSLHITDAVGSKNDPKNYLTALYLGVFSMCD